MSIKVIKSFYFGIIFLMKYVKIISDYSRNSFEKNIAAYLANSLDSCTCFEEIKNINFKLRYVKPIHDFIIYSTAVACECFCTKQS